MKQLALSLISICLGFCAIEVFSRICERVLHSHDQYADLSTLGRDKSHSDLRIFIYGGSVAYGAPAPELGVAKQVEFYLKEHIGNRRVRVVNLASGGEASSKTLATLSETIDFEPDVVVVMSLHNDFLDRLRIHMVPLDRILWTGRHFAAFRLLNDSIVWTLQHSSNHQRNLARGRNISFDVSGSEAFVTRISRYEANIRSMIHLAHDRKIPIVIGTGPSNLSDWPPVDRGMWPSVFRRTYIDGDDSFRSHVRAIEALFHSAHFKEALLQADEALVTRPGNALLTFWKGKSELALGRIREAKRDLEAAKDLDPVHWRQLSEQNNFLRTLALEHGVYVADFAAALEREASHGIVGLDLMVDNCHPNAKGSFLMAKELLRVLSSVGLAKYSAQANEDDFSTFMRQSGFYDRTSHLEFRYFMSNAAYVSKVPFVNYSLSREYLSRAIGIEPNNPQPWAQLASVSLLEGHRAKGTEELKKALMLLSGRRINPVDRGFAPHLEDALEFAGLHILSNGEILETMGSPSQH